jgi:hypothetical protein
MWGDMDLKKKLLNLLVPLSVFLFISTGCGPSASEKAAAAKSEMEFRVTAEAEAKVKLEAENAAKAKLAAEAEIKAKAEREAKEKAEAEAAIAKAAKEEKEKAEASLKKNAEALKKLTPLAAEGSAMDDRTYNFIVSNNTWFPAKTEKDKKAALDTADKQITTKNLFKNVEPYLDTMVAISGRVVQVREENTPIGTIATIHILDSNGNSVVGLYLGSTGKLLDGDLTSIVGVPISSYSFKNVSGGTTIAILLALSDFK